MSTNREKARKSGGMKDAWQEYHGKGTAAKTAQHPHSKLKTQKELKKITDSKEYKKADYKKKTEMLGGKVYAKGGRVGFAHGSKRPKGGWTD